jgi:metal-responsive CopG/Arc/MetJ family transcriptional regulator
MAAPKIGKQDILIRLPEELVDMMDGYREEYGAQRPWIVEKALREFFAKQPKKEV